MAEELTWYHKRAFLIYSIQKLPGENLIFLIIRLWVDISNVKLIFKKTKFSIFRLKMHQKWQTKQKIGIFKIDISKSIGCCQDLKSFNCFQI